MYFKNVNYKMTVCW